MANNTVLQVRLVGPEIAPGLVRSSDLADIIDSVEDMIASVIVMEDPSLKKDEIVVGLLSVGEGSMTLEFASPLSDLVVPAFQEVAKAVEHDDYRGLPTSSINALERIATFSRKSNSNVEFRGPNRDRVAEVLGVISPSTTIKPVPLMMGPTTIHGKVIRVGGRKPKVMIELPNGESVFCDIEYELAKELGQRLYSWVGLYGTAKWDSKDLSLKDFSIDRITEYEDTPLTEAVAKLSEVAGQYFEDIDDVEGYISALRSDRREV